MFPRVVSGLVALVALLAPPQMPSPRPVCPPSGLSTSEASTSLSDTSAGNRAWFDTVAKLVAEVAEVLHYAHGQGIVHRDVKP